MTFLLWRHLWPKKAKFQKSKTDSQIYRTIGTSSCNFCCPIMTLYKRILWENILTVKNDFFYCDVIYDQKKAKFQKSKTDSQNYRTIGTSSCNFCCPIMTLYKRILWEKLRSISGEYLVNITLNAAKPFNTQQVLNFY